MNTGWIRKTFRLDEELIKVGLGMNKGWIRNEYRLDKESIYAG